MVSGRVDGVSLSGKGKSTKKQRVDELIQTARAAEKPKEIKISSEIEQRVNRLREILMKILLDEDDSYDLSMPPDATNTIDEPHVVKPGGSLIETYSQLLVMGGNHSTTSEEICGVVSRWHQLHGNKEKPVARITALIMRKKKEMNWAKKLLALMIQLVYPNFKFRRHERHHQKVIHEPEEKRYQNALSHERALANKEGILMEGGLQQDQWESIETLILRGLIKEKYLLTNTISHKAVIYYFVYRCKNPKAKIPTVLDCRAIFPQRKALYGRLGLWDSILEKLKEFGVPVDKWPQNNKAAEGSRELEGSKEVAAPNALGAPRASATSSALDASSAPAAPNALGAPNAPVTSKTRAAPSTLGASRAPAASKTLGAPKSPTTSTKPTTSRALAASNASGASSAPAAPNTLGAPNAPVTSKRPAASNARAAPSTLGASRALATPNASGASRAPAASKTLGASSAPAAPNASGASSTPAASRATAPSLPPQAFFEETHDNEKYNAEMKRALARAQKGASCQVDPRKDTRREYRGLHDVQLYIIPASDPFHALALKKIEINSEDEVLVFVLLKNSPPRISKVKKNVLTRQPTPSL